jgi:hypothetical protein
VLTTNYLTNALADKRVAELRAQTGPRRHKPKISRQRMSLPQWRHSPRPITAPAAVEQP